MKFGVPRIWREPQNHVNDCFFCIVNLSHLKKTKNRSSIIYPDVPSSRAPTPHSESLPIPLYMSSTSELNEASFDFPSPSYSSMLRKRPLEKKDEEGDFQPHLSEADELDSSSESDETVVYPLPKEVCEDESENKQPHFPNQNELNDLIREMGLTKFNAELLTSRLKQWNLLDKSCKITSHRRRHERFSQYFSVSNKLCYCHDVNGLFEEIEIEHISNEWRLFIDSSSSSLKCVLLHNGNKYPSIPIGHSTHLKEEYDNVKFLLVCIQYEKYQWFVCGDFKIIGFLMGLQGGYTKHSCFICLWDSQADPKHYDTKKWPLRQSYVQGTNNIKNQALVDSEKVLMPPLHINLGLIKQFVKAMNKQGQAFQYLHVLFPKLSKAKIEAGIFNGLDVRKMFRSKDF